ncbi:ATP-binding protein [Frigoribacterium sp. PvP032]|uniref:sensor histidine kinase n=1 Tax=Frigoribacterium sp. PvP032 TaxID=2806589 RepID=UPI001AE75566|nr:ATP-binding protein [Frigoribacterium sp. PvP032]MBP1189657.1 two-component system sensor histidine kinase KdpD [Frigoribacterium sp. PvP032]
MTRGRLRVLLGAAPGVGKTFTMLEEGARLRDEGKDVVVAVVETHGRAATAARLGDLEVVPRERHVHRGVELDEMDLEAVLARAPQVALVDELAHSNAPGSRHDKRWRDVQALLDAGISVVSTVNVQHVESLADVVEQITGAAQHETVPDAVLRSADQIEVVDLAPQALRDRLAAGDVYPAARVDAALSNYFRLGNLTALRELALLWLADEVDSALRAYRVEHGIDAAWEARERVVVALTGGAEGETLIRRAARIAARSAGGELIAVHVSTPDGLRQGAPGALAAQRALVEKLGGSYHQVVGSDVPRALVDFAKGADASQLVIGVSRRSRLASLVTGPGIGATVIRESGQLDVHMVTHSAAGRGWSLPKLGGALSRSRVVAGFVLAAVVGPLLTWLLAGHRSEDGIAGTVLLFQLLVVVVAVTGGVWPALFAALLSGVTLDLYFIAPIYELTIAEPLHLLALVLYVLNAAIVSWVVDQAARRSRSAARALAETELLATVSGSVLRGQDALEALVARTREAFGLTRVRVLSGDEVLGDSDGAGDGAAGSGSGAGAGAGAGDGAGAGARAGRGSVSTLPAGEHGVLELTGEPLQAGDRRLLAVVAAQVEAALEHSALTRTAGQVAPLAEVDRMRSALLAAVGHDLRRPLAAATASVSGLRQPGVEWSDADRDELLATAWESLESLSALVTNLLDVSRVQAGALAVRTAVVDVDDVVLGALDELGLGPADVELALRASVPAVVADAVLLQRVLVNLLDNALRHSPDGTLVRISTSGFAGRVEVRVVDRGPGVPPERRDEITVAFQRLGDTDNSTGLGLGLALSKGFTEAMGGTLTMDDTPGGGLTAVVSLPEAPAPAAGADPHGIPTSGARSAPPAGGIVVEEGP